METKAAITNPGARLPQTGSGACAGPDVFRYFILCAGGILLAAAMNRFLIAAGNEQALALPDPMLGIPLRYAVLIVGAFELTVAWFCLFGKRCEVQLGWLVWFSTSFILFWGGVVCQNVQPQGACIGSLTDPLHLYHGIAGYILEFLPFCLAVGSYAAAALFWLSPGARAVRLVAAQQRAEERDVAAGLLKMSCPSCSGHIKFASQNIGQSIPCPHCHKTITLRKPDNLKMSCFFCQEHIEFPSHAIGGKISCPHCKMNITLQEQRA